MNKARRHSQYTESLARLLRAEDIYSWLVTEGYYPEQYVLPPVFHVRKRPRYGKRFTPVTKKFTPPIRRLSEMHFPKTDLADRTFGIIDPEIHSDIANEIATNWDAILDVIFHPSKHIYSYSFPIPVSSISPGQIGQLRAGRMIYEWIEMVEEDLVEEAYAYSYLVRTDVKNCYPSVYTHSIAWVLHTRDMIRKGSNRHDYALVGNRLDKLFQNANDGCTNGLPVGPVVSDLVAELILSAVDLSISADIRNAGILALRFKDDYRFLCRTQEDCRKATKLLQKGLKAFNLLLNEDKTEISTLPEGIFREWVSRYHSIRPSHGKQLSFAEFKELYLGVLQIDQELPGTGIIDRFIADVTSPSYEPLFPVASLHYEKTVSLLLMMAERRARSLPRLLGLIEALMVKSEDRRSQRVISRHLNNLLHILSKDESENHLQKKNQNLRDHMTDWELIFTMFGEKATTDITKEKDSRGLEECKDSANKGGTIAKRARKDLEKELGKSVISDNNFLDRRKIQ